MEQCIGISHNGKMFWGVGIDADIIKSSIQALTVAVNQLESEVGVNACKDDRLNEIMNYIHTNYLTVTLDELADEFHLSKPYLSKYIKEKSGMTFGLEPSRLFSIILNEGSRMERAESKFTGFTCFSSSAV